MPKPVDEFLSALSRGEGKEALSIWQACSPTEKQALINSRIRRRHSGNLQPLLNYLIELQIPESDKLPLVKALVAAGADPAKADDETEGFHNTAFLWAIHKHEWDIVRFLIDCYDPKKHGDYLNKRSDEENFFSGKVKYRNAYFNTVNTPLIFLLKKLAYDKKPDLELFKALLEKGANVNLGDGANNTAMHYVAAKGDPALIKLFLQYKPDLDKKNIYGLKPWEVYDTYFEPLKSKVRDRTTKKLLEKCGMPLLLKSDPQRFEEFPFFRDYGEDPFMRKMVESWYCYLEGHYDAEYIPYCGADKENLDKDLIKALRKEGAETENYYYTLLERDAQKRKMQEAAIRKGKFFLYPGEDVASGILKYVYQHFFHLYSSDEKTIPWELVELCFNMRGKKLFQPINSILEKFFQEVAKDKDNKEFQIILKHQAELQDCMRYSIIKDRMRCSSLKVELPKKEKDSSYKDHLYAVVSVLLQEDEKQKPTPSGVLSFISDYWYGKQVVPPSSFMKIVTEAGITQEEIDHIKKHKIAFKK